MHGNIFSLMWKVSASYGASVPFGWLQSWVYYTVTVKVFGTECKCICKSSFREGSLHTLPQQTGCYDSIRRVVCVLVPKELRCPDSTLRTASLSSQPSSPESFLYSARLVQQALQNICTPPSSVMALSSTGSNFSFSAHPPTVSVGQGAAVSASAVPHCSRGWQQQWDGLNPWPERSSFKTWPKKKKKTPAEYLA